MKTQNTISKNCSKVKSFVKNFFFTNRKQQILSSPAVTTTYIPPKEVEEDYTPKLHINNNRKQTKGRRIQMINMGNGYYKRIIHSY